MSYISPHISKQICRIQPHISKFICYIPPCINKQIYRIPPHISKQIYCVPPHISKQVYRIPPHISKMIYRIVMHVRIHNFEVCVCVSVNLKKNFLGLLLKFWSIVIQHPDRNWDFEIQRPIIESFSLQLWKSDTEQLQILKHLQQ